MLDAYLFNPRKEVPGTNMAFVSVRNDDQRAKLILYLESATKPQSAL
jgi:cytochrome c